MSIRSRLSVLCTLVLAVSLATFAMQAPVAPVAPTDTTAQPAPVLEGVVTNATSCACTCAAPIWELQDVYTEGTCAELVGQTCYTQWGPGTFSTCF